MIESKASGANGKKVCATLTWAKFISKTILIVTKRMYYLRYGHNSKGETFPVQDIRERQAT